MAEMTVAKNSSAGGFEKKFDDDLPFVSEWKDGAAWGVNYWDVATTGRFGEDCEVGKVYGQLCVEWMRKQDAENCSDGECMLAWIVESMAEFHGESGKGIRVGFLSLIAEEVIKAGKVDNLKSAPRS